MPSLPPEDVVPILVADLADEASRNVLESAARRGGRVYVPLETAPVNTSPHVLEVHTPGAAEPLLFLAEPLGPPTEHGFPLRIRPMTDAPQSSRGGGDARKAGHEPGIVKGRGVQAKPQLSDSHTADLSHVGPLPTDDTDPLVGRALAGGKLSIEELIGRGGVGAVYKARHRELQMPVAVKVLRESFQNDIDFCRRFYAEALAASRLDHRNVTRVIDFGQEPDGLLYLAMEFLDGIELRTLVEKERVLEAERIAQIVMQVCAGLSHAHARGIVHRDVKPENLVLIDAHDDDGRPTSLVKVCDFGIAQHRAGTSDGGLLVGTPEYMSPEQCRGQDLDARSDVYTVGIVLYELATGQVPFSSDKPAAVLEKQKSTPPLRPSIIRPEVDPLLESIIMKALAKDPAARHPSMRELRAELRELLDPVLSEAMPESVRTPDAFMPMTPAQASAASSGRMRAAPEADGPSWLERGAVYATSPASTRTPGGAVPVTNEVAQSLAHNAAAWLKKFSQTTDPRAFLQMAQRLDGAIKQLAASGDTRVLWAISRTLNEIAARGAQAQGSPSAIAGRLLRAFEDPHVVACVAEQLLTAQDDAREAARRLLVHAGVAGAHGLYAARVKHANVADVRAKFVAALNDLGKKAWPVVRAALERLAGSVDNPRAMELAEDLLLCVPAVGDESSGHLVVKFLRVNVSGVSRAATASIVRLWGDRAKPLLVGMLQSKEDAVRIAGIAGLHQLKGIDEHVVLRLSGILTRRVPAGAELRAAAAIALGTATGGARQPALSVLSQVLTATRAGNAPVDGGLPQTREEQVVLAAARSLLQLGGVSQRSVVAQQADRSPEPLRTHLRRLLGS